MLGKYIAQRFVSSIPVLVGVTLITFLLLHAVAGSFVPGIEINPYLTLEDVERLRRNLGLDQPLYVQYLTWMSGLLRGDFGRSMIDGSPVTTQILDRLPNTLELTITALLIALLISIPAGALAAQRPRSLVDQALTALSVAGVSVPSFWLGLLLIQLLAVTPHSFGLGGLPASGATAAIGGGDFLDRLAHLVMPATVLSFFYMAVWSRFTRSSMLEVLSQDYIRTARAKGLRERRVVYLHALRNAVTPLVALIGLEFPGLLSGGAVVEVVFGWPGLGRFALERSLAFDYTSILGLTTFTAILVVVGNLLADVLLAALDPRIRYK